MTKHLLLSLALATMGLNAMTINSGAGNPNITGSPMINITNVQSPWVPNGTTDPFALWVFSSDSGFNGPNIGPALGTTATYTASFVGQLSSGIIAKIHADDGASFEYSTDGGVNWVLAVNSMGAPQATYCVSVAPSCTSGTMYEQTFNFAATSSLLGRVTTRQDVDKTPSGVQFTLTSVPETASTPTPEPSSAWMAGSPLALAGLAALINKLRS